MNTLASIYYDTPHTPLKSTQTFELVGYESLDTFFSIKANLYDYIMILAQLTFNFLWLSRLKEAW